MSTCPRQAARRRKHRIAFWVRLRTAALGHTQKGDANKVDESNADDEGDQDGAGRFEELGWVKEFAAELGLNTTSWAVCVLAHADKAKTADVLRQGPIRIGNFCTRAGAESLVPIGIVSSPACP